MPLENEDFFFKGVLVRYLIIYGIGRSIMWESVSECVVSGTDMEG